MDQVVLVQPALRHNVVLYRFISYGISFAPLEAMLLVMPG